MIQTIEKTKTLNELITNLTQKQSPKIMIKNLDEAFFQFSAFNLSSGDEHSETCWSYQMIKEFLLSLKDKNVNYDLIIDKLISHEDILTMTNAFTNFFYYTNLGTDFNEDFKVSLFLTFKNIKDFIISLEPYYIKYYADRRKHILQQYSD